MTSGPTEARRGLSPAVLVAGMLLLAVVLRFWRLGFWGFEGDEIYTLRDSLTPQFDNPRPLMYLLNYYVVRPFAPLDEFGLRLLPAIFGVLAIPAFYLVCRRLAGTRAALFGTLLLAVSGIHVYQSQYARYWSLVFLLSTIYPFALYLGLRERNWRALALGLATAVLAVLAHPVAVLPAGGVGLWIMMTYLRRDYLARIWSQKGLRWGVIVLVVVGAAAVLRYLPVLRSWIDAHDAGGGGDNLLYLPGRAGVKQIAFMMSYFEGLTLPLVLTGVVGTLLLWQGRDRSLAVLLACLFAFPVAVILVLSFRTAVSITYLLPTAPAFFVGAGVFLDRLAAVQWELRPRWVLPATVTALIVITGLPTLLSQYRDGRRRDFRGAAKWLTERLAPGDIVYSDQAGVLTHYLPGPVVESLVADPALLGKSVRDLRDSGRGQALWIVLPASAQGGLKATAQVGSMSGWIYENCQLRNTIGVARLDFRQNQLQVYRCPAAALPGTASKSE
ncbi:MAG: glycosyltransferase family 39 protein [Gemmatimonadales bacterium]